MDKFAAENGMSTQDVAFMDARNADTYFSLLKPSKYRQTSTYTVVPDISNNNQEIVSIIYNAKHVSQMRGTNLDDEIYNSLAARKLLTKQNYQAIKSRLESVNRIKSNADKLIQEAQNAASTNNPF